MSALAPLRESMSRLGDSLADIEAIFEEADGAQWSVEFTDGSVLDIEFDEARQRIALTMALGAPPPEHRAHTCEMLLTFNLLWQEELPVRMALGSPGEDVVQVAEFDLTGSPSDDLPDWVHAFAAIADQWREHVLNGFQTGDALPLPMAQHVGALRA